MNVHFIAIGGAAMHNLALALHNKGYQVTGSDDTIFEPSKSRLDAKGLLPETFGWYPEKITSELETRNKLLLEDKQLNENIINKLNEEKIELANV